jgi:hypothetical protein
MPGRRIRLGDVADARSGDKGASANVGVIAHSAAGYGFLRGVLTTAAVARFFAPLLAPSVPPPVRYELPNLHALNFFFPTILGGGGSVSLRVDAQGKGLGQAILEMPLDVPEALVPGLLPNSEARP